MAKFRNFSTYMEQEFHESTGLVTSNNASKELWSMLRMPAKVPGSKVDILKGHGITDPEIRKKTLNRYKGFILQAEANWRAAEQGEFHSSPLLYYYCFLNLVKAKLVLNNPDMDDKIHHGIALANKNLPSTFNQVSLSTSDGVFKEYYRSIYQKAPANKYTVKEIIPYLQELSMQLLMGNYTSIPLAAAFRLRVVLEGDICWMILMVSKLNKFSAFKASYPEIFEHFEETEMPLNGHQIYAEAFGDMYSKWKGYDFYQSKTPVNRTNNDDLNRMVREIDFMIRKDSTVNLYNNRDTAVFNLPIKNSPEVKLNEELSIYMFMFILSSLVRYNPDYFNKKMETNYGFLIECFVDAAPERFLKFMVNRIYQSNIKVIPS